MTLNIMMDARDMYPVMYHPQHPYKRLDFKRDAKYYSRTRRPVKYYWIDFGLSSRYTGNDETEPLEVPIWGGDRTVPEFQGNDPTPRNPFPTDVYCLGNIIREEFIQVVTRTVALLRSSSADRSLRSIQISSSSTT